MEDRMPQKYQEILDKVNEVFYSTIVPKHYETIKRECGSGFVALNNDEGGFISYDKNGIFDDAAYDTDKAGFMSTVDEISVMFAYEFGSGHLRQKKGDPKHVPTWYAPFNISHGDGDEDSLWDEYIKKSLKNFSEEFPHVYTDSDSDFGYQSFFINLSKV